MKLYMYLRSRSFFDLCPRSLVRPKKYICAFQVSRPNLDFCPDPKHFIVNCKQNVVKFAGKWGKMNWKMQFYIKYFDKIKCYADRPYLVFSELKPETHIYFVFGLMKQDLRWAILDQWSSGSEYCYFELEFIPWHYQQVRLLRCNDILISCKIICFITYLIFSSLRDWLKTTFIPGWRTQIK